MIGRNCVRNDRVCPELSNQRNLCPNSGDFCFCSRQSVSHLGNVPQQCRSSRSTWSVKLSKRSIAVLNKRCLESVELEHPSIPTSADWRLHQCNVIQDERDQAQDWGRANQCQVHRWGVARPEDRCFTSTLYQHQHGNLHWRQPADRFKDGRWWHHSCWAIRCLCLQQLTEQIRKMTLKHSRQIWWEGEKSAPEVSLERFTSENSTLSWLTFWSFYNWLHCGIFFICVQPHCTPLWGQKVIIEENYQKVISGTGEPNKTVFRLWHVQYLPSVSTRTRNSWACPTVIQSWFSHTLDIYIYIYIIVQILYWNTHTHPTHIFPSAFILLVQKGGLLHHHVFWPFLGRVIYILNKRVVKKKKKKKTSAVGCGWKRWKGSKKKTAGCGWKRWKGWGKKKTSHPSPFLKNPSLLWERSADNYNAYSPDGGGFQAFGFMVSLAATINDVVVASSNPQNLSKSKIPHSDILFGSLNLSALTLTFMSDSSIYAFSDRQAGQMVSSSNFQGTNPSNFQDKTQKDLKKRRPIELRVKNAFFYVYWRNEARNGLGHLWPNGWSTPPIPNSWPPSSNIHKMATSRNLLYMHLDPEYVQKYYQRTCFSTFQCPDCGRTISSKSNLSKHRQKFVPKK